MFTEDILPPTLMRLDGEHSLESIKIVSQDICKILKDLDPHKTHGPCEIQPYVLKKFAETLDRPWVNFKNQWETSALAV